MRIGCFEACACVNYCYETAKHALCVTILKLDEIKHSPEAFQKVCVVAFSTIREINYQCNTNYLPHFLSVLDTAPAFDFYGICRLPRFFLHPYYAERMDEFDLLDQLEVILCDNWHLGIPDQEGNNRDEEVRKFAQEQLQAFLDTLVDNRRDFSSEEEVRQILHNWLEKNLEANPHEDFDPHDLNLQDLKVKLKPYALLETISIYALAFADVSCVPDFLQIWGIINLAPLTNAIGRVPLFGWVPNQVLGDWVWTGQCVGFFFQFLNAFDDLWKGKLSTEEKTEAKWILVASLAETLYCFSNIVKSDPRIINGLALVAKSLGLIAFFSASQPTFFTPGEDAFAIHAIQ